MLLGAWGISVFVIIGVAFTWMTVISFFEDFPKMEEVEQTSEEASTEA